MFSAVSEKKRRFDEHRTLIPNNSCRVGVFNSVCHKKKRDESVLLRTVRFLTLLTRAIGNRMPEESPDLRRDGQ